MYVFPDPAGLPPPTLERFHTLKPKDLCAIEIQVYQFLGFFVSIKKYKDPNAPLQTAGHANLGRPHQSSVVPPQLAGGGGREAGV
jgi:hypothetical protein